MDEDVRKLLDTWIKHRVLPLGVALDAGRHQFFMLPRLPCRVTSMPRSASIRSDGFHRLLSAPNKGSEELLYGRMIA